MIKHLESKISTYLSSETTETSEASKTSKTSKITKTSKISKKKSVSFPCYRIKYRKDCFRNPNCYWVKKKEV